MSTLDALLEQQVKEAQAQLRHIDELMDRARASTGASAPEGPWADLRVGVEAERRELAKAIEDLRRAPAGERTAAAQAGQGAAARLRALGLKFEKALTAIGDPRGL